MANTVIINDEPVEYQPGERLLTVARRNAAHIGFVCDGRAICQTCRSRILQGSEYVSEPNRAERSLLPEARLEEGYRLACQTTLQGPGTITCLTRAEEIRRQTINIVSPPEGTSLGENLGRFIGNAPRFLGDQASLFPSNIQSVARRVLRLRLSTDSIQQSLTDFGRVTNRMIKGKRMAEIEDRQETPPPSTTM